MFQLPSFSFFSTTRSRKAGHIDTRPVDIPSVEIHEIETSPEKRTRTLKHLIRANHVNHAILFNHLRFHNHAPHILGSAYLLKANSDELNTIYDEESKILDPWKDSPGEVSKHDWREYLGDKRYQRAFVDFFEDELVAFGYDWKQLTAEYLFSGEQPLINGIIAGLAHPLIHMGYAYELSNRTIAIEALSLTATCYNDLHKYLDDPSYTRPSAHPTSSLTEIFRRLHQDDRFSNATQYHDIDEVLPLELDYEDLLLEYWNSWKITDPKGDFEHSQRVAVLLLTCTQDLGSKAYNFFLLHLLTSSHAVRILLPLIPTHFHISLVRQWWLFTLTAYISQRRPAIRQERIKEYELKGRDWKWADRQAVKSKWATDAHYVKGIRAMKEASQTWGDNDDWYLRAAVRFAAEFDGWAFDAVD